MVDQEVPNQLHLHLGLDHKKNNTPKLQRMKNSVSIPSHVARTQQPVRFSRGLIDARFSENVINEVSLLVFLLYYSM